MRSYGSGNYCFRNWVWKHRFFKIENLRQIYYSRRRFRWWSVKEEASSPPVSCMAVLYPAAPSLIGFVVLQKKKDSKREMKKLSPVNCKKMRELNKKIRKWEKTKKMMNLKADFICLMTQMVRHLNMITLVHTLSLQHIRYGWIILTLRLSYAYVTAEFIIFITL